MAEESSFDGSEKEEIASSGNGFGDLASMDSIESRWVTQDEDDDSVNGADDDDDDDDDEFYGTGVESEDEEVSEHRLLIRTGRRVDSFDVEALEVPGASRIDYEVIDCFGTRAYECVVSKI